MTSPIPRLQPIRPDDPAGWPDTLSDPARRLLEYWASRCDGGRYPARADIEPGALRDVLPWIFIVECLPGEVTDYRFRLVGTRIAAIEGECTGRRLSDMFPDRTKYARLWKQYDACGAGRILIRHENLGWKGKTHINYQVVLLPLRGETGEVEHLIGAAYSTLSVD